MLQIIKKRSALAAMLCLAIFHTCFLGVGAARADEAPDTSKFDDWQVVVIHDNVEYFIGSSDTTTTTTGCDVFLQRKGVCRDCALLGITFCRALNIPARFVVDVEHGTHGGAERDSDGVMPNCDCDCDCNCEREPSVLAH